MSSYVGTSTSAYEVFIVFFKDKYLFNITVILKPLVAHFNLKQVSRVKICQFIAFLV